MDCSLSDGASQYLDVLYEEYEHFDVQQTTVGVNPHEFAALEEHPDGVAIRVRVGGEDGTLMLSDEDEWELPGGVIDAEPVPETIAALVERKTGVQCEIDGLDRISIVCLQCEVVGDDIWTLSALFTATAVGGSPRNGAIWRDAPIDPVAMFTTA
jgi:hypothetical protein